MATSRLPEVWLRGPLEDMPALLQPVAHALLQAREEIHGLLLHFPETLLWERPAGLASVGFHVQHLSGVIDRLFTYARGEALTTGQLRELKEEGKAPGELPGPHPVLDTLLARFDRQVDLALVQLRTTDPSTLTDPRGVGRAQIPSTVMGLLVHAAEHTMRHTGQLLVTVRLLTAPGGPAATSVAPA